MMNRGGGARPGMGGNTMAGNLLQGMYAPGPGASFGTNRGPGNNFGMGQQPPQMNDAMYRLQKQCMAGDGSACQQLEISKMRYQDQNNNWYDQYNQQQQMYQQRTGRPMGAGRGW